MVEADLRRAGALIPDPVIARTGVNSSSAPADVAVIVPTFNRLDLLVETAESLRRQTLGNAHFLIVDDWSERPTREYLESLPRSDSRFRLIEKQAGLPRGCQTSRNIGLDAANAAAVVFLDSDDTLEPTCIERRFAWLRAHPETDIAVGSQAILGHDGVGETWLNVPNRAVADIDRLLNLTSPLDVPWINGGAMIRRSSLISSGVRWRPEFHWDDVAFHFECLASGLTSGWMPRDDSPDSHYRTHTGQRYGSVLFTDEGIENTATMLRWIRSELGARHLDTDSRLASLERAVFRSCVLPTIDAGRYSRALSLIWDAESTGVLSASSARRIAFYAKGRRLLAGSDRATFYWNRFNEKRRVPALSGNGPSTYGTVKVHPARRPAN